MKVFKGSNNSWLGAEAVLNSRTDIKAGAGLCKDCIMLTIGSIKEDTEWLFLAFDLSDEEGKEIQTHYKSFLVPSIYKRRLWQALKEKGGE
jgi:hypothetical protein